MSLQAGANFGLSPVPRRSLARPQIKVKEDMAILGPIHDDFVVIYEFIVVIHDFVLFYVYIQSILVVLNQYIISFKYDFGSR